TVTYAYSNIGRPVSAVDNGNSINYVTQATYAPQGAIATYRAGSSGTFSGIDLSNNYNNRLQPSVLSASIVSPLTTIFNLSYSFSDANGKNNGNVLTMQNNVDTTRTQNFTYDYLNRLSTAKSSGTSGLGCWGQGFTYDRYGNISNISN